MINYKLFKISLIFKLFVVLLIWKVTIVVMIGYRNYLPLNFQSDFLRGRESYFFGAYHFAFYTHIASGPVSLFLGTILLSESFRVKYSRWHRNLGRIQTFCVLFLVAPSGLLMAYHAATGTIAALGFATLAAAAAAAISVALGWRAAVTRRYRDHQRWMLRCFLLLCSAVVLRLFGGLAVVAGIGADWAYSLAAWASWLVPLAAFELSPLGYWRSRSQIGQHDSMPKRQELIH